MPKQVSLQELARELTELDDFVICGHVSPDGDCLGSQLALAAALRSMGKKATCLLAKADPIDFALSQLPGIDNMVVAGEFSGKAGTFVTVDVPTIDRIGEDAAALHARADRTITIDHHVPVSPLSETNYVHEDCPATALIIWDLIEEMGVERTAEMAVCCYVGLMTDTGRFQYQNTSPEAFSAASQMVAAGADPASLARLVYQNRSAESLALMERMLSHREFHGNGRFAVSHLLISDFSETGSDRTDAEELVDVLRSVRGVRVACLLREQDGAVRGSLRAKDDTDVSEIARSIGGGGHKAAAGFTFKGSMDGALEKIRTVFAELADA